MKLTFFILTLFTLPVFASILPSNNSSIPLSSKNDGLTESQYHEVINKVEAVYRPVIEKMGRKLTINRLWESPVVNAGTLPSGKEIIINLYGGYARHPMATEDGYALVICHELGHHFGGIPRKTNDAGTTFWPATEGQSDYFATLKCLRKVFERDNNKDIISKVHYPDYIRIKCDRFPSEDDRALCIRSALAGMATASISASVTIAAIPDFESPDKTIVEKTLESHPAAQCRLDTYFQGSICKVNDDIPLSDSDEAEGSCHTSLGFTEGVRPLCWFRPTK